MSTFRFDFFSCLHLRCSPECLGTSATNETTILDQLGCTRGRPAVVSPAPKPGRCPHIRENKPNFPGSGGHIMFRQSRPSGVLPPRVARVNSRFREAGRIPQGGQTACEGLVCGFGCFKLTLGYLPLNRQLQTVLLIPLRRGNNRPGQSPLPHPVSTGGFTPWATSTTHTPRTTITSSR